MSRSLTGVLLGGALVVVALQGTNVLAENVLPTFTGASHFSEQSGEALYKSICQGCHMPDAQGARGAGQYPALANNPRLADVDYPILMVSHGSGGMPPFQSYLSDAQIAAVVGYVRTHFGNKYMDAVTAEQVHKTTSTFDRTLQRKKP